MNREQKEQLERELRKRLGEAEAIYRRGDYTEALRTLNALDLQFPHERSVLTMRTRVMRRMGRESISDSEMPIEPEGDALLAGLWGEDVIERKRHAPYRVPWMLPPSMGWDPTRAEIHPYYATFEFKTDPANSPVYDALLVVAVGILLLAGLDLVFSEPRAGTERMFAGIAFVWAPSFQSSGSKFDYGEQPFAMQSGFWISKYELRFEDWLKLTEAKIEHFTDTELNRPVCGLTLEESVDVVERLNRTGEGRFRFPFTDEWRYAARAGAASRFFFGDTADELGTYARYGRSRSTLPVRVGETQPNAWGLYNVYGNVAELTVEGPAGEVNVAAVDQASRNPLRPQAISDLGWRAMGGAISSSREDCVSESGVEVSGEAPIANTGIRLIRLPGRSSRKELIAMQFPNDRSIGTLYSIKEFAGLRVKLPLGEARGEVTTLRGDHLGIVLNKEGAEDLTPLESIESDKLIEFTANSVGLADDQLKHVARFTNLELLNLDGNPVSDRGIAWFPSLQSLREAVFSHTTATGASFSRVAGSRALELLDVRGIKVIVAGDLIRLRALKRLSMLDLRDTPIKPEDLTELQIFLPLCEILPEPAPPSLEDSLFWASGEGHYSMLLHQIRDDRSAARYGRFEDLRYRLPDADGPLADTRPGYRVYLQPYWYIWQKSIDDPDEVVAPWSPANAQGEPSDSGASIDRMVWCPEIFTDSDPWLMLEFPEVVHPSDVWIYTRGLPLFDSMGVFDLDGTEFPVSGDTFSTQPIASIPIDDVIDNENKLPVHETVVFVGTLRDANQQPIRTNRVRLRFRTEAAAQSLDKNDVRVDAVAMAAQGRKLWASSSAASSFLGDASDPLEAERRAARARQFVDDPGEIVFRGTLRVLDGFAHAGKKLKTDRD